MHDFLARSAQRGADADARAASAMKASATLWFEAAEIDDSSPQRAAAAAAPSRLSTLSLVRMRRRLESPPQRYGAGDALEMRVSPTFPAVHAAPQHGSAAVVACVSPPAAHTSIALPFKYRVGPVTAADVADHSASKIKERLGMCQTPRSAQGRSIVRRHVLESYCLRPCVRCSPLASRTAGVVQAQASWDRRTGVDLPGSPRQLDEEVLREQHCGHGVQARPTAVSHTILCGTRGGAPIMLAVPCAEIVATLPSASIVLVVCTPAPASRSRRKSVWSSPSRCGS
jgi:hypothetical protein